jgi:hypothetical protein
VNIATRSGHAHADDVEVVLVLEMVLVVFLSS